MIGAIAELADLTVLHLDEDFELIGQITGQPVEKLHDREIASVTPAAPT